MVSSPSSPRCIWQSKTDGDIGDAYESACRLEQSDDETLPLRQLLVQVVRRWTRDHVDGVIVTTGRRMVSIEFFAPLKSKEATPWIEIHFGKTRSMKTAERFLQGQVIGVLRTTEHVYTDLVDFLANFAQPSPELSNPKMRVYEGFIVPRPLVPDKRVMPRVSRLASVLGCSYQGLALFRIALGLLLVLELVLRFRFLEPFYSDQGTLPTDLLLQRVDPLYRAVCLHCQFGQVWEQQVLLSVQVTLALFVTVGYQCRLSVLSSWYLYFSLTLRNTWMNYILDRYFHYLLFISIFLPLDKAWSVRHRPTVTGWVVSPATVFLKGLVLWIYLDAGLGKYFDPLGGWTYNADPLPALDTYARHTLAAQYLYGMLGPPGLRLLTPVVVYVELFAAPVTLMGAWLQWPVLEYLAIGLICSLHIGIALTLRNAALLSFVACVPWLALLPNDRFYATSARRSGLGSSAIQLAALASMAAGCIWLGSFSQACDQSVQHIWSTLLHNRWNVFVGAEEYVTWEIAPGELENGSIVDVWGRRDTVSWSLPGDGAPCTATGRPGRWRSFPYLAELEGAEGDALWSYLCREWDAQNPPERRLVRYNFFMLQADVLPQMQFSATRKRLIHSYECPTDGRSDSSSSRRGPGLTVDEL